MGSAKRTPKWDRRGRGDRFVLAVGFSKIKNGPQTGAVWRPPLLTYFILVDPFWGPPGGPQNGAAAHAAIKIFKYLDPREPKTDPKLGPPGGPDLGSIGQAPARTHLDNIKMRLGDGSLKTCLLFESRFGYRLLKACHVFCLDVSPREKSVLFPSWLKNWHGASVKQ